MTVASTKPRIDWVDAGRGLAIALVVLFHAANWLHEAGLDVAGWRTLNDTIASIRLPLFFTMAGLFAGKWVAGPWSALWRSKLSLFVWVYAVWSIIATFSFMLGLNMQGRTGNYLAQFRDLLWAPLLPRFELWFIWALVLFFIVAKLIRRLPVVVQLGATGLLSLLALSNLFDGNAGWVGTAKYLFFFLAGLLLRDVILRWSTTTRPLVLAVTVAVWIALVVPGRMLDLSSLPGYYFVSCIAGVAAGVAISRVLVHAPGARYLGSRTLPVYLTHTSIILVLAWSISHFSDALGGVVWGWIITPAVAAVAIALSLLIARAVRDIRGLRLLYEQPAWLAEPGRSRQGRSTQDSGSSGSSGGAESRRRRRRSSTT